MPLEKDTERRHDIREFADAIGQLSIHVAQQSTMISALTDEIRRERDDRHAQRDEFLKHVATLHEKINKHALHCDFQDRAAKQLREHDAAIQNLRVAQVKHWTVIATWGAMGMILIHAISKPVGQLAWRLFRGWKGIE